MKSPITFKTGISPITFKSFPQIVKDIEITYTNEDIQSWV